ncbi:hypothetical protein EMCRGX_G022596 [Ephydatia muelleri]
MSFLYPSKYKKHLESISHQRRVEESRFWQSTCTSDAERSHEFPDDDLVTDSILSDDVCAEFSDDHEDVLHMDDGDGDDGVDDGGDGDDDGAFSLEDHFEDLDRENVGSYSPFPSKLFALLFILVNSPHPMGEKNLSFVWFILKQLDMTVPSLASVKAFKLPNMEPPMRETAAYFSQHPLKVKAAGKRILMLPLILLSDDTSGNKSKKWHKFESWYLSLAGLPRSHNTRRDNIHFVCCSDKVSPIDLGGPIAQELTMLETEGTFVFDALYQEMVLVLAPLLCIVCDNPRASELLNHLGSAAIKFCRICMTRRTESPDMVCVKRTKAIALQQITDILAQRTESERVEQRKAVGLREDDNPLLTMPADLYESTPVEVLHTLLLGTCKHILKILMPKFSAQQKREILARIRAFNTSGFNTKMYGNVCQYYQSFVGRDFKGWAQMCLFILGPYLNEGDSEVLLAFTKVFQIAYCDIFKASSADSCRNVCHAFVDSAKRHMPTLLDKQKTHLLLHLVDCMVQFGPSSAFSAERCGIDLKHIYSMPLVQHLLCGTSMQEIYEHRAIYQQGAPRKVSRCLRTLSTLRLVSVGRQNTTLDILLQCGIHYDLVLGSVTLTERVTECGAVMSQERKLVNSGDFIEAVTSQFENYWSSSDGFPKKELYRAELTARTRRRDEDWATYGDVLRTLADKAYSDLEEKARERLALATAQDSEAQIAVPTLSVPSVDTGAAVSLLSSKIWREIENTRVPIVMQPWLGKKLVGVDGTPLSVRGCIHAPLCIGGTQFNRSFVIASDLWVEAIVGLDFIRAHKCVIDCSNNTISFKSADVSVELLSPKAMEEMSSTVRSIGLVTTERILVPPECEMELMVTPVDNTVRALGGVWMVENDSKLSHGVIVARAITCPSDGLVPIRILNPRECSIELKKGTELAKMDHIEQGSILNVSVTTSRESSTTNQLLWEMVNKLPRRVPQARREEVRCLLIEMLDNGVIEPSDSSWSSPVVLAKKKDGSLRFCVDYRKVNAVTRKDAYPHPRVEAGQSSLPPWTSPVGTGSSRVLGGLKWSSCLVYFDDIIVIGSTFSEHLKHLAAVLTHLRQSGLKLNPTKCKLCQQQVMFLGHIVSTQGISTDPEKVEVIAKWPTPQSKRDVQQFLGLANYYRRFIKDFGVIAKPLNRLTEKNTTFEWSTTCQRAFENLRNCLVEPPVLAYPNYTRDFLLDTDASNCGIGAVLSQVDDSGAKRVICYASRSLSRQEQRYCVTRRELLAVVEFTQHFRHYLLGRKFI